MSLHYNYLKIIATNDKKEHDFKVELRQIYTNCPSFFTRCPVVFPCYEQSRLIDMRNKNNKERYEIVFIPFAFAGRPAKSFEVVERDNRDESDNIKAMSVEQLVGRNITRISETEQKEINTLANKNHKESLMAQLAVVLKNVAANGLIK